MSSTSPESIDASSICLKFWWYNLKQESIQRAGWSNDP